MEKNYRLRTPRMTWSREPWVPRPHLKLDPSKERPTETSERKLPKGSGKMSSEEIKKK